MTFSVSRDEGQFEWAGSNLMTVFCQPSRLLDGDMWRLIWDVMRFNACARRLVVGWSESRKNRNTSRNNENLEEENLEGEEYSIGEYLDREGYSDSFRDNYLIVSPPKPFTLNYKSQSFP